MTDKQEFARQVRRTAVTTVALVAALVFGIVLLITGDWLPGGIAVVATTFGLASQIPVIRKLCSTGPPPTPPRSRPTG